MGFPHHLVRAFFSDSDARYDDSFGRNCDFYFAAIGALGGVGVSLPRVARVPFTHTYLQLLLLVKRRVDFNGEFLRSLASDKVSYQITI